MANQDLILTNRDLSLGRKGSGLLANHNLVPGRHHAIGLDLSHDHELDSGHAHDRDPDLRHTHDHKPAVSETREQELLFQRAHGSDREHMSGNDYQQDSELGDRDCSKFNDSGCELGLTPQSHGLDISEAQGLDMVGSGNFDENLELTVDQSRNMVIVPASQMTVGEAPLVPVVQSRALVSAPNHELIVGQEFSDVFSCRRVLRDAAIAHRFEIQTIKSDKNRFTAKCANEGCAWRIHAAKLPGVPTFTIRTIHGEHTCLGLTHLGHQQASVQWVAESVEQCLRKNLNCKPKDIVEEIHRVHGITLSYKQAWRGKERVMASVRGSFEEAYRLLPQYCEQIRRTNPGSVALVYRNPVDNCFHRLFFSFQASIYGFLNGCRPLIGLDRTILKSKYLGALLLATGFDGNGALFPLAFGVVDEESDGNWMWFLSELHNLLETNTENMPRLTILSDRHKGIVDGVNLNFPTAFHGFCMRYLSESFRKEFDNALLVNLLWEAAQVPTVIEFEAKLFEVEAVSQEAASWIRQVQPRLWATAYFEGTRYGHLTANIVESLNTWILEASGLPITQMMECIRRQLMAWFNEQRERSMEWTSILVPHAEKHVSQALEHAYACQVLKANDAEFEVIFQDITNVVDVRNRSCSCHGWQLYGLPCAHAVAALLCCGVNNVHRFAESCFTVAAFRKAYSQTIHPIPDKTLWTELSEASKNEGNRAIDIIINPPKSLSPPGRPSKKRKRVDDGGRVKRVVHCSRCNQTGHFRTTCAAPL